VRGEKGNAWTIRGRILDGDGEPVPDALLEICRGMSQEALSGERTMSGRKLCHLDLEGLRQTSAAEFQFSTRKPAGQAG